MQYPRDNRWRWQDPADHTDKPMAVFLAVVVGVVFGMCASRAVKAQPAVDCYSTSTANPRYFADRDEFTWCIPPQQTMGLSEWEVKRLDSPSPVWLGLGYSVNGQITVSGLPAFARYQVRYRLCEPTPCSEWSPDSIVVATGPDVDLDNSGVVTVWDVTQACGQFINKVSNYHLTGGEYVP